MPSPVAPRHNSQPRARRFLLHSLQAIAALGVAASSAHAQLPRPAGVPVAKPEAVPQTSPARSEQKAPALPAPALPQPATAPKSVEPKTPIPAAQPPVEEAAPAAPDAAPEVSEPTPSDDGSVVVVPQDAPEFPLEAPTTEKPAPAKPKVAAPAPKKAAPKAKKPIARVGGIDVSVGTEAAALAKLEKEHQNRLSQPIVLRLGAREFWTTRSEIGASLPLPVLLRAARVRAKPGKPAEVALRYEVDGDATLKYLQKLAPALKREPQPIGDGTTGRAGEELSLGGSLARVKAAVQSGGTEVELLSTPIAFVPKPAPVVPESGDANFPLVLAEYSTRYNARLSDRTENLRIAAREINGTVIQPGQVFSANAAIGPRSTQRGFRAAHIFMGKKVIEGVGGGICQSATTVYNAALGAKLSIVERHSHSLPVSYATPKNDATIYWGQKDMRFRNNTGRPILVRTYLKEGRFHAQILAPREAAAVPTMAALRP